MEPRRPRRSAPPRPRPPPCSADSPTPPQPTIATRSPALTPRRAPHRAHAGRHRAADERRDVERDVLRDRDARALGHDAGIGEGREEGVVVDRLAVAREPRRPVHQAARRHRRPHGGAELRQVARALLALAAPRCPRERDVVADADARDAVSDRLDDARALVPEHARARVLRCSVDGVPVGVADAARVMPDEHLLRAAGRRGSSSDSVSGPPVCSRTTPRTLHAVAASFACSSRSSSIGMWQRIR